MPQLHYSSARNLTLFSKVRAKKNGNEISNAYWHYQKYCNMIIQLPWNKRRQKEMLTVKVVHPILFSTCPLRFTSCILINGLCTPVCVIITYGNQYAVIAHSSCSCSVLSADQFIITPKILYSSLHYGFWGIKNASC